MYYTGLADESGDGINEQIRATKELGWHCIEARSINRINIHDLSDADFDFVAGTLDDNGISINCFGSTVANWSCDPRSEEDFLKSLEMLKRALIRMKRLNCRMIRGMSFTRLRDDSLYTKELENNIFDKINHLVRVCEEAGVEYMHENCANYGGMSSEHTLRLLDNVKSPHFKLLFDTGNPLNSVDYRSGEQNHMQNSWQFYNEVKDFVAYVHIKDGRFVERQPDQIFNKSEWTFPGEGEGCVKEIISDLLKRGYDGGLSIEPHMQIVYHAQDESTSEAMQFNNYVEYGRRLMTLVEELQTD